MNISDKEKVFITELDRFENSDIKEDTIELIKGLPDYFFVVPASSSGKYHPLCDLGNGGLVRHTKVVCRVAEEYFRNDLFNMFDSRRRDLIRMSLILHDGFKNGMIDCKFTVINHPLLIANYVYDCKYKLKISTDEVNTVIRLLSTHMGPWVEDKYGNTVLPVPQNYDELFVHNCDYIASRKFLNFNFENDEIVDKPLVLIK